MSDRDPLVKLHVDLPNHWLWKGESMWVRPLGGDLYEIENSPFCAYGLSYKDVVIARSVSPALNRQFCPWSGAAVTGRCVSFFAIPSIAVNGIASSAS